MKMGRRMLSVLWAGLLALLIQVIGQLLWGTLLAVNLKATPNIPWAVAAMAVVLWAMWQYLSGRWWPRSTSQARKHSLRARAVSRAVFAWSIAAGVFSIVALSGLWIVLFQISPTPANAIADISKYPLTTVIPVLLMSCLAAPFTEEPAFRGYAQSILERNFRVPTAIVISSLLFAAAHLTYGFFWTKLTVYFLFGVACAVGAHLAQSIAPVIASHSLADLTFFTLVWRNDATRRLVTQGGADTWFWIRCAQIVMGAVLAIWAFWHLARASSSQASRATSAGVSLTTSVLQA